MTSGDATSDIEALDLPDGYDQAVAFLGEHIGLGVQPGLDRMRRLLAAMGDPQDSFPVVHVAGTNGKTSTSRMITTILAAHGMHTGTFISPHLSRVEQRFSLDGIELTAGQFAEAVRDVAVFTRLHERRSGERPTYFELTAALAFNLFALETVQAGVIEVGLGGRLDATNVVDADVSVITSLAIEHVEYLGSTINSIAAEKAAILDEGGTLVTGAMPAGAEGPVTARVAETGSTWFRAGADFRAGSVSQAVGGWLVEIEGIHDRYTDLVLPVHGRHQVANLITAVASVEALFGRALDLDALREGVAAVTAPGRLEIVGREPLVVLDGAHNPAGMEALATALEEEFLAAPWQVVFGVSAPRDAALVLEPLAHHIGHLHVVTAAEGSGLPAGEAAGAVRAVLDDSTPVDVHGSVAEGVAAAVAAAGPTGSALVTGSLYVVGEARSILVDSPSEL